MKRINCCAGTAEAAELLAGRLKRSGVPIFSIDLDSQYFHVSNEYLSFSKALMCNYFGEGANMTTDCFPDTKGALTITCPDSSEKSVRQILVSNGAVSIRSM